MRRSAAIATRAGVAAVLLSLAVSPAGAQLTLDDPAGGQAQGPANGQACDGTARGGRHLPLADGRELVIGGVDCDGEPSSSALLLDPATGQSTPTGPMSIGRTDFVAIGLGDGDVAVIGGATGGGLAAATDRIEEYDLKAGRWTIVAYMAQRRAGMGACVLDDGRVLLVGGRNGDDDRDAARTRTAELFDPHAGTVRLLGARTNLEHRANVQATRLSGDRCLVTSRGESGLNMEIFDARAETFAATAPPPTPAGAPLNPSFVSELPDGTILLVGRPSLVFDARTGAYRVVPGTDR